MARQTEKLLDAMRLHGPQTARELGSALGISQPTVSRELAEAGLQAVRIGRARRVRYAATRDVRGLGTSWPLFRIGAQGRPTEFGHLTALHGRGSVVDVAEATDWLRDDFVDGLFPRVPWFLDDQRPQGFLGRQFALRWARELGLPNDILRWGDDAVLAALLLHGEDGPGNFVLGQGALERALQAGADAIPATQRHKVYDELASAALAGEPVGSSAAGEQPKFTAAVADADGAVRHVIVKFSEPVANNPAGRRWGDLLVCEHIAGKVLAAHGVASAATELIHSNGRVCLEVTRFDRIGAYGRRGCVTLAAWSDAHDGERDDWASATSRMRRHGWVDANADAEVRRRWWFGRLIGNTDMHFGNLCFFLDDALPLTLTPNYDMLPMMYRPAGNGALVAREYVAATPTPADMAYWREAAVWSARFWREVAHHPDISDDFREIARVNGDAVQRVRERFDGAT